MLSQCPVLFCELTRNTKCLSSVNRPWWITLEERKEINMRLKELKVERFSINICGKLIP